MKNKIAILSIIVLTVLLIFNINNYSKQQKKSNYYNYSKVHIFQEKIIPINKPVDNNGKYLFRYLYRFLDCEPCIYRMYESLDYIINKKNISIEIVIVDDNYNEAKKFLDNFYYKYYGSVNFFYLNYESFYKLEICETPFLEIRQWINGQILINLMKLYAMIVNIYHIVTAVL